MRLLRIGVITTFLPSLHLATALPPSMKATFIT